MWSTLFCVHRPEKAAYSTHASVMLTHYYACTIAFQATLIVTSLWSYNEVLCNTGYWVSCTHLSPGMKLTKCSRSSACSWCGMKTMPSHVRLSHRDITLSISLRALADGKIFQTCTYVIVGVTVMDFTIMFTA